MMAAEAREALLGGVERGARVQEGRAGRVDLSGVLTLEVSLYLLAIVAGVVLRLLLIDERPLSLEEGSLAAEAYSIAMGRAPDLLHQGAVNAYGTALSLLLFGAGDGEARLVSAVAGSVLIGLPYLLRRQLGRVPAVVAAFAIVISPVMLFGSRNVGGAALALTASMLLWAALEPGVKGMSVRRALAVALLTAVMVASGREGVTLLATMAIAAWLSHPRPSSLMGDLGTLFLAARGRRMAMAFVVILVLIGTGLGSNPKGLQWAAVDGWSDWARSFTLVAGRGNVVLLMLLYEWPAVLLGLPRVVRAVVVRDRVDSFLSLWFILALVVCMLQEGEIAWRVILPTLPLYLLAARTAGGSLRQASGLRWDGRTVVAAVAVGVPIAVGIVLLNRVATPATATPVEYFYVEICLLAVGAVALLLLRARERAALAWWTSAILVVGFLVHSSAFLNYRAETVGREPLVGTQVSPVLREASRYESYISRFFRVQVTVDPELRGPLVWYLRDGKEITYSTELTRGVGIHMLRGDATPIDPGSDRRPGLYSPTIVRSDLTWQEVWRWAVARDGLVRANQRDIIVRAPAGNW